MAAKTVWALPQIEYQALNTIQETRPVALLTSTDAWSRVGSLLNLPLIVQAEPTRIDREFMDYLSQNVPALVEVIYVVGSGDLVELGKFVAFNTKLPLVIIPTELDSDQFLEPHVELLHEDIITNIYTGAAEKVIIDWAVIQAAEPHRRAGMLADMIAIVTGLLDWRYAAKMKRTAQDQPFVPWAAGVSAGLASQAIKMADAVGRGEVEALSTLLDLASVSVQLANQLGHARQQEGTEHYFAFALQKQGVSASHAECLGPGILFASALHSQDPSALREALEKAGIRLNQLRPADMQLAISDLPGFVAANNLPYGIAHDLDPFSDAVQRALDLARLAGDTGGWALAENTGLLNPQRPSVPNTLPPAPAATEQPGAAAPAQPSATEQLGPLPPQQ
jgi:glycerol-1-phosphate dehydrogenase [NAD(P)+]